MQHNITGTTPGKKGRDRKSVKIESCQFMYLFSTFFRQSHGDVCWIQGISQLIPTPRKAYWLGAKRKILFCCHISWPFALCWYRTVPILQSQNCFYTADFTDMAPNTIRKHMPVKNLGPFECLASKVQLGAARCTL